MFSKPVRILFYVLIATIVASGAETPVVLNPGQQLLVDDHLIAEAVNLTRVLGSPVKANGGNPVVFRDQPWEKTWIGGYMNVLRHEDRFQLYYMISGQEVGYAESEDGFNWTKPLVGPDKQTNVVFPGHGFSVSVDPHDPDPNRRYKAAYGHLRQIRACLAHSPDGVRWTTYNDGEPVTGRASDTHNQIIWDSIAERYLLFTRTDFGARGGVGEVRGTRSMANPDVNANPSDWTTLRSWKFDREGDDKRRQLYAMTCWIHEGIYFGLMTVFVNPNEADYPNYRHKPDYETKHEENVIEFYLSTSRDAAKWDLHWVFENQPLIPRGPAGSWDKDAVYPSSSVITVDDEHYFYYSGGNERHGCAKKRMGVGLATLPLNRMMGFRANDEPGVFTTRAFELQSPNITINADASGGRILTEVLDGESKVIPGFGKDHAIPLSDVDDLQLEPKWREKRLAELSRQTIRLRFHLESATMFAFDVTPE